MKCLFGNRWVRLKCKLEVCKETKRIETRMGGFLQLGSGGSWMTVKHEESRGRKSDVDEESDGEVGRYE